MPIFFVASSLSSSNHLDPAAWARVANTFRRREQARIRRHFRDVLVELRATPTASLTEGQRAHRAFLLDELAAYRFRSRFPLNRGHRGRRAPYFIDDLGTRCAMAHLMERGGAASLAQRIARDTNNAYVRELAGDDESVAWLGQAGLTLEEAARIQPDYCFVGSYADVCCSAEGENGFPPRAAVEGKVEVVDAMAATIRVAGPVHGDLSGVENGTVLVAGPPQGIAVGDTVLVLDGAGGTKAAFAIDGEGRIDAPCAGYPGMPTKLNKATVFAIADGGACTEAILDNEPGEWGDDAARCSDCSVTLGDGGGAGAAVAIAVIAAASMRLRRQWRPARRSSRTR